MEKRQLSGNWQIYFKKFLAAFEETVVNIKDILLTLLTDFLDISVIKVCSEAEYSIIVLGM